MEWQPISTFPMFAHYFDAFTVMREKGEQVGEGVRHADVRWSESNSRFEDSSGKPVEIIDERGWQIFITHWMPIPASPKL